MSRLSSLVWYMLGGINVFIFIVWDLPVLAAASAIVGVSFMAWARRAARPLYGAVTDRCVRK